MPKMTIELTPVEDSWLSHRKSTVGVPKAVTIRHVINEAMMADDTFPKPPTKPAKRGTR